MVFQRVMFLLLVALATLMLILGEGTLAETPRRIDVVSNDASKTHNGYLRFRSLTPKKERGESSSHEMEVKGRTSYESSSSEESSTNSQSTFSSDKSTTSGPASTSTESSSSTSDSTSDTKPSSSDDSSVDVSDSKDLDSNDSSDKSSSTEDEESSTNSQSTFSSDKSTTSGPASTSTESSSSTSDSTSDTKPSSSDDSSVDVSDSKDLDSNDSSDKSSSTEDESSDSDDSAESDIDESFEIGDSGDEDTSSKPKGCSILPGELIDPCNQPVFKNLVPNAVDPAFIYEFDENNKIAVEHCKSDSHVTGLVDENGNELTTTIYGYGAKGGVCTWPGMTFETQSGEPVYVTWENNLPIEPYILTSRDGVSVVDTSFHWAYSIEGYDTYSIDDNGVPVVPHLHGGHDDSEFDGNPEFFFSPNWEIRGPQWQQKEFVYDNSQPAATNWYHDHALGITRLNVYAGMAGFFLVRDDQDTGKPDNPLGLPVFPYEAAFAIQDRMFKADGSLFYPAFPGDPFYEGFIVEEGAELPEDQFPNGGATALAEFFGDVMLVNGVAWPKMDVEPRNYRLRLLNGCDSRFLIIRFYKVKMGETEVPTGENPLEFVVIASDQSLATEPRTMDMLLIEPGSRYDVVFNFEGHEDSRIIMLNIGPDEPFSGDIDDFDGGDAFVGEDPQEIDVPYEARNDSIFKTTRRIMAFDVVKCLDDSVADEFDASNIKFPIEQPDATRTRKVALFEGLDVFGRLQPLLGVIGPATDLNGNKIFFPTSQPYQNAGTAGLPMEGTLEWHEETTENPKLDSTEIWELWNMSGDAHPIHIHLVYFEVLGRKEIKFDNCTTEEEMVCDPSDAFGDGTYLQNMKTVESTGKFGSGFKVMNPTAGPDIETRPEYFENARKDVVTALPGQITTLKMTFDKPGRFVWHCHILSHEDHEMMRVLYVGDPSEEIV